MMQTIRLATVMLAGLTLLSLQAQAQPFVFPLQGSQENPAVTTGRSGYCMADLNLPNSVSLHCTHNVTDVTGAHIHRAAPGVNGPIVFFFSAATTIDSVIDADSFAANQAANAGKVQEISFDTFLEELRSGNLYVNIHSPAHPAGELRGQIDDPLYFPQFGTGPGFGSDITLLSAATTGPTAFGFLNFHDPDGNPLSTDSVFGSLPGEMSGMATGVNVVAGNALSFSVDPLDQISVQTKESDELILGSAFAISNGNVGGVLRFAITDFGVAGVLGTRAVTGAATPARRQEGGISTGVAIQNASFKPIEVTLRLLQNGQVVDNGETTVMLGANARTAGFIQEFFPDADTSDFDGVLQISSDDRFAAIALEQDLTGVITVIPVVPTSTP